MVMRTNSLALGTLDQRPEGFRAGWRQPAAALGRGHHRAGLRLAGMRRLAVQSALTRDIPLVMGLAPVASALVVLNNLLVDVAYSLLDPRVEVS
jgi:hypothetical protein